MTMHRLRFFVILSLFLFSQTPSVYFAGSADLPMDDVTEPSDAMSNIYTRKVLVEISLDYQGAEANTKHDSQRGKPGIGFRNP
ncbi:hypothetical protein MA16_Dca004239 [Dendrobium catenatum]|uniref:Uncharacterized protein n=1 Tax=Dendrobium catenatum TaxID=906689 RepID=A0A2I0W6W1_9ASPA|nr:hypothetical protein MA16_Dca004239 [Dendrobium catenatum]